MYAKSSASAFKYIDIDSDTLEITLTKTRGDGLVLPAHPGSSKMWEVVRYKSMYPAVYAADREKGISGKYALADAPLWLTVVASVMWEGVIQGAAWDVVKFAVHQALTKLSGIGLAPAFDGRKSSDTSIRTGWREYSQPGRKQYEMFLSIRRSVKSLPERESLAYARAGDSAHFGRLIRGEDDPNVLVPPKSRNKKASTRSRPKVKA
ncbi:MAG: hypothetical protein WAK33_02830 [Silvibacterium sp.]